MGEARRARASYQLPLEPPPEERPPPKELPPLEEEEELGRVSLGVLRVNELR